MLGHKAQQYFQNRDHQDPAAKKNRRYFQLMFSIADSLLNIRKAAHLTQHDLANLMNTTQSTIARWETAGYTGYTLRKLFELADHLGYSLQITFVRKIHTQTVTEEIRDTWDIPQEWLQRVNPSYIQVKSLSRQLITSKE